eukprot:365449-Chlamydomonas_euryale.AAC.5
MTIESPPASREDELELAPLAAGHASSSVGEGGGGGSGIVVVSPSATTTTAPGGGRHGRRGGGGAAASNGASAPRVGESETQAMLGDASELSSESTERSSGAGESSGRIGTQARRSWLGRLWGKLPGGSIPPEQTYAQVSSSMDGSKGNEGAEAVGVPELDDPGSKFSTLQFLRFCGSGYVRPRCVRHVHCPYRMHMRRTCATHVYSNHHRLQI